MARGIVMVTLLLWGCTHASFVPPSARGAAAAPKPTQARAQPARSAPPLELSPAEPAAAGSIVILEPRPGQELSELDAPKTSLRVQADRGDFLIELGLDGSRGRPLSTLPEVPTLADLAERPSLTPGEHFVVAALRRDENAPARFAVQRFSVGHTKKTSLPIVYCGRPAGTYYAARGSSLLLDFAIDGFELGPGGALLVRASRLRDSGDAREARLRELGPKRISGIGADDWRIELALLDASGEPLSSPFARAGCELTLNEVAGP